MWFSEVGTGLSQFSWQAKEKCSLCWHLITVFFTMIEPKPFVENIVLNMHTSGAGTEKITTVAQE